MNKIELIKQKTAELLQYCHEYYTMDSPSISDLEYDRKFDELKQLEDEANFWLANSPTRQVQGQVLDGFAKVAHSKPMLSAAKTKDVDEIKKFVEDKDFYCSYKLDGLSLVCVWEDGKFKQAVTRGTGLIGEDCTEQAKMIGNLPMTIPYKGRLELRGECVISWDNFNKINETLEQPYSHPRNLTAGSLRNLDTNVTKSRNLSYMVFECVSDLNDVDGLMDSKELELRWLDSIGFETVGRCVGSVDDCVEGMQPEWYQYPVDGLIFEYNNKTYSKSLGANSHSENCRMAMKWSDDLYETTIRDIDWTMGKTGTLTPTAIFDVIEIDGADVGRASLHNLSIMEQLNIRRDCTARVYKANMIVPQVYSTDDNGIDDFVIPHICPICNGQTEVVVSDVFGTKVLMCTNPNCSGKLLGKLSHFVSRKAMNIDGMSTMILNFLINKGWVNSFQDLYHLTNYKEEWIKCDGFGTKSVDNLLEAIENSRKVKLEAFISALSIPGIGTSAAKTISSYFGGDFYAFIRAFEDGFDWTILDDFGIITAQNINDYLAENKAKVVDLATEMEFIVEEKKEVKDNPFMGKSICCTGKLVHFTRDSINAKIVELGAKVASGVSAKTDILITNTPDSGSSKNVNAKKYGTKIITEQQFLEMIGE